MKPKIATIKAQDDACDFEISFTAIPRKGGSKHDRKQAARKFEALRNLMFSLASEMYLCVWENSFSELEERDKMLARN